MSRLSDLIAKLCPDGVTFEPLGKLLNYEQPGKYLVDSAVYDDSNKTPVLTAGKTFLLGYTAETHGIYRASPENPVVIFDDFTTAFKWVDFPFKAKSSAMKMLTPKPGIGIDFRFVYYAMLCNNFSPQEHARHWIGKYSGFRVPVPPLEVQEEIVRILDHFTELEAELEAELAARRRQYAYYRESLFAFPDPDHVHWLALSELGTWYGGGTPSKGVPEFWDDATVPWLSPKDMATDTVQDTEDRIASIALERTPLRLVPPGSVAFVVRSNILRRHLPIAYVSISVTLNQDMRALVPKGGILASYVAQACRARREQILRLAGRTDGSMAAIQSKKLMSYHIPIPSSEEQERIVAKLDEFDVLVNDPDVGLPAELAARRKQYAHYRHRLLEFEEVAV